LVNTSSQEGLESQSTSKTPGHINPAMLESAHFPVGAVCCIENLSRVILHCCFTFRRRLTAAHLTVATSFSSVVVSKPHLVHACTRLAFATGIRFPASCSNLKDRIRTCKRCKFPLSCHIMCPRTLEGKSLLRTRCFSDRLHTHYCNGAQTLLSKEQNLPPSEASEGGGVAPPPPAGGG
jgi:hypothetical protein